MARIATLVVAATTVLAVASPPSEASASLPGAATAVTASAPSVPSATTQAVAPVDEFSFVSSWLSLGLQSTMPVFVEARAAASPSWHDWTTDGCSTPGAVGLGDTGRSFNFRSACWRHDFSYRNTKLADWLFNAGGRYWNSSNRYQIDRQLLADMKADCAPRSWTQRYSCLGWAETYYRAVRTFGGP
jgi:Prokaryotic phospholipase A2